MCGIDPYGLNSFYSSLFVVLAELGAGLQKPNDGLVSFQSCLLKSKDVFKDYSSSDYYSTTTNHADITCRNGNGFFGNDRKPCNWFIGKGV
jgi:hypothetical protein